MLEMEEHTLEPGHPTLLSAHVVHVIDPSNFWIQIGTEELFEQFAHLEEQLQDFCEETGSVGADDAGWIEDGSFIVARSNLPNVGLWRRAQVARQNIEKGTVDVFYLDYGTTEIISLDQICRAVPAFFFAIDHQAWKCELAGIRPIAKTWTTRAVKYFQKLTSDVIFQASVVSSQTTFGCLQIALYTNDGKDGHSLAHKMFEEEIGMLSDTELVAEFARDVRQVVPPVYSRQQEVNGDQETNVEQGVSMDNYTSPAADTEILRENADSRKKEIKDVLQEEQGNEEGEVSPEAESPGEGIPGFNLNSIFKTKMATANLIEQKKEDARKRAVTTAMEKDLEIAQKDMAESVPNTEEYTEWGASDYYIGQQTGENKTDVCSLKLSEFREAIGDTYWSPSMTECVAKQKPILQELKGTEISPAVPKSDGLEAENVEVNSSKVNTKETDSCFRSSPTPGERTEASVSRQLSKILNEEDLDDPGTVCHKFNSVVTPDGMKEPRELSIAVEVLLEAAIISDSQQDTVLNILDTYVDSVNFSVRLEAVLKQLETRFTKPLFGKAGTHYKKFGQVLGQLLIISRLWNTHVADVVQELVLNVVEKWAIFNRHGYQVGVQNERMQSIFVECLEGFWDVAGTTISDIDPSTFVRIQEWLQDKVLAHSHPREIREQVLKLLLKVGPVRTFSADQVKPRTRSVEIQTEILPSESQPSQLLDEESSMRSSHEGSSVVSHSDTEIEDASSDAVDPGHGIKSSPVAPSAQPAQYVNKTALPHNSTQHLPERADEFENVDPLMSEFSSWAHCVSMGKRKSKKLDTKEISGLRAVALQTLNGENYVFSGKFVKDLPPRFKKHLTPNQSTETENLARNDPHFYKKSKGKESLPGLDYYTPSDSSGITGDTSGIDKSEDTTSCGNSIYSKLGLGDFPSVKDILNSSLSQKESNSSKRQTSRSRSITPVNNTSDSEPSTRTKKRHRKKPMPSYKERSTSSPKTIPESGLNPNANEWSPVKKPSSRSFSQSPVPTSSSSNSSWRTSRKNCAAKQPKSSSSKDDSSIKSIVMDIFGEGDGEHISGHNSEVSEMEKCVTSEKTESDDGANTSFCVSEITSEVEEDTTIKSEAQSREVHVLPEHPNYTHSDEFYGDDYDDDDDDAFFVSGFDDGPKSDSDNQVVSSHIRETVKSGESTETISSNHNEVIDWDKMDYSKPLDSHQQKPREPRYKWEPGQRKCTRCGAFNHTVYSCKEKKSMIL